MKQEYEEKTMALVEATKQEVIATEKANLPILISQEVEKVRTMERNEAMRMRLPLNYNNWTNSDRKLGSDIPFSYLRRMSTIYPIARACINYRIRQITQLKWDITTVDEVEDEKGYKPQIDLVRQWLKQPMGHKTRTREMLTIMVDDILSVDALAFEIRRRMKGEFMNLIPVDPTTIVLRLTETGATPEPPEVAYAQYIAGQKIAEFTTDEFLYESMNTRSYSPYGLAPLESLILQAESAMRGALYNLNYLRENNLPEGFLSIPEEVAANQQQVEEWQMWFDAIMAGDQKMVHRLKIIPGGAEYTPTKKPEDMSFERFELWLLQQTCAVFEVPPQAIGINYQVNRATSESQQEIGDQKGLYPLANFVKEILDDIIQQEFGFDKLQFKWVNIDPVDLKEEVEIAEKEIKMGALSVDEYRMERGREPIGLGPVIWGTVTKVEDVINPPETKEVEPDSKEKEEDKKDDDQRKARKLELDDLRRWRKAIYSDLERGKRLRVLFPSQHISPEIHKFVQEGLAGVNNKAQAKLLFDQFLDPQLRSSMKMLDYLVKLEEMEDAAA